MAGQIRITLKRSVSGCTKGQKATIASLGLKRRERSRVMDDNQAVRGAIRKMEHLLEWEEV